MFLKNRGKMIGKQSHTANTKPFLKRLRCAQYKIDIF